MSEAEIMQITRLVPIAQGRLYPALKRVLEPLFCLLVLVTLLPFMAIIAVIIMLDSPGSFLFRQERIGKNGRPFHMFKFRTMVKNHKSLEEEKYMADYVAGRAQPIVGPDGKKTYKSAKAASITRVGRILRKTSLDELPQILNVLLGDMSVIGPRPNVKWEVDQYTEEHCQRLAVLPGITGLAQVRGRSNISFEEIVAHDLEYVRRRSLKLDLQILWWTVLKVIDRHDAG